MSTPNCALFTSRSPRRLTKSFELAPDGALKKSAGGALTDGTCTPLCVTTPDALVETLLDLSENQAIGWGIPTGIATGATTPIASAKKAKPGTLTRTRDRFDWPAGPGWLMLDYDPPAGATPLTRDALRSLLIEICPDFADTPMVMADSASSWIYRGDECLKGAGGLRCYVLVADARDIPRAGAVLFDRAWLSGHGFYVVSASGQLLKRAPIDAAVWQPERLDFAAGAACGKGLEQRRPAPRAWHDARPPMDSVRALPDLSTADQRRLKAMREEAAAAVKGEQEKARAAWLDDRLSEAVAVGHDADTDKLRERLTDAAVKRRLHGDFELQHQSGQVVTVADILANPGRWHGERFADPLEPDYRDDQRIARADLRAGRRPSIYSHAHGGVRYTLLRSVGSLKLEAGEKPRLVRECDALMQADGTVYQRGGLLVRVTEHHGIRACTTHWLRTHLEELSEFQRFDGRSEEWVRTDAPEDLAKRIAANIGAWGMPELKGVVYGPLMRADGSLLDQPGYDTATGLLLIADTDAWPAIPTAPTHDQVRAALATLWEPFASFPFVDDLSRGVHLAALLTAVQRPIIPTAPMFGWNAYRAGSGKSKAAKATAWLGGEAPTESPWSDAPEEQRKRLMSVLLAGPQSLLLDNISSVMSSDTLCAVLTSEHYRDRKLGVSEDVSAPTQVLMMATGNNLRVGGDLSRRVLIATMDHGVEHPERLAFSFDPVARVRDRWLHYRAAALVALRAFQAAGAPRGGLGRMGSYEVWDDMIRQYVVWIRDQALAPVGVDDPMHAVDRNWDADPETGKLTALMAAWAAVFSDAPKAVADVIRDGQFADAGREALIDAIDEIAGEGGRVNSRRLGRWLERHAGRIVDGRRFVRVPGRAGVARWRLEHVKGHAPTLTESAARPIGLLARAIAARRTGQ